MRRALMVLASLAMGVVFSGCGYSEEEWQAQLAKYGQLNNQYQQEKDAHAATRAELDKVKKQVSDLSAQLKRMGVDLENLNAQLQATGTEKEKLSASLDQLKQALEEYKARAAQLERIKQRFELLKSKLQKLTQLGLKVEVRHNRMVISLPGDVLFASGSDKLRDEGLNVLKQVADVIKADAQLASRYFQVAGHTDNKPLKGGPFKDNWGLSAMRARSVLVFLIDAPDAKEGGGGLDASKLHAAGYGDTDPVADNSTDAGRQQNRRVELVLMPDVEEMLDLGKI
ncbi:MAG: OmpA family protein [Sorangiineae bacterium]|nr:OmpA family protein [Polyangiaceae bacterium]MEB2323480.1 OmpA family protein [Sorangiineae bacterium]